MHSDVSTNDDAEGVSVSTDNNKYKCEFNRPNDTFGLSLCRLIHLQMMHLIV